VSDLEFVAFDIETTGFDVTDHVTVVGFELDLGCRVFVQAEERSCSDVEASVRERTERHVVVSVHESEQAVLDAVSGFVEERLRDDDVLLVGFNAETWQGGFDLPFLRSRYAAHGIDWPFVDLPYADLFPVMKKRFNTTYNEETQSDLPGVYEALCDGALNDVDPFADSEEAVTAFTEGRFAALVTHNVADVLRTGALGAVAQEYCSKSDFSLKSLTPTVEDV